MIERLLPSTSSQNHNCWYLSDLIKSKTKSNKREKMCTWNYAYVVTYTLHFWKICTGLQLSHMNWTKSNQYCLREVSKTSHYLQKGWKCTSPRVSWGLSCTASGTRDPGHRPSRSHLAAGSRSVQSHGDVQSRSPVSGGAPAPRPCNYQPGTCVVAILPITSIIFHVTKQLTGCYC